MILWKPYMFSCRTKLENCSDVSERQTAARRILTLLCLKWEPRMVRLNSPTLDTTKLAMKLWEHAMLRRC